MKEPAMPSPHGKIWTWILNDFGEFLVDRWWAWSGILLGLLICGVL
jgi:hypothetical protein